MGTMFETKTIITKAILNEFAKKTFKILNKKYRIFVLSFAIISGLLVIMTLIVDGLSWLSAFLFLVLVFFLFMFFKGYILKLGLTYKNFLGLYGELPQITSKFYNEKMETITSRSSLTIDYNQITKIVETENLYLLMIEGQGIILSKSGFINGDIENFKAFIKEKCINA